MNTLLALISDVLLPADNQFPRSWHLFRKLLKFSMSKMKKVHICVHEDYIFNGNEITCPKCNANRFKTRHLAGGRTKQVPKKWFYYVNFIDRLKKKFAEDKDWVKVYYYVNAHCTVLKIIFDEKLNCRFCCQAILYPHDTYQPQHGYLNDIYDGKRWKDHSKNGGILSQAYNTAWSLNTDGISVFKSMQVSIWPVFLMNLNLEPKLHHITHDGS